MSEATGVAQGDAEDVVAAEVPLVRKRRRLVKAGQAELEQGNVLVEATGSERGGANQAAVGPSGGKVLWRIRRKGRLSCP